MIFISNAIGGVFNVFFIAVFLVVISGYLAFSVSYNKAYKVKNKIINSIEECEGNPDCFEEKVNKYIDQVGYNASVNWNGEKIMQDKGHTNVTCVANKGYCYADQELSSGCNSSTSEVGCKHIYTAMTSVTIELPVISNLTSQMSMFTVSGVTSAITVR